MGQPSAYGYDDLGKCINDALRGHYQGGHKYTNEFYLFANQKHNIYRMAGYSPDCYAVPEVVLPRFRGRFRAWDLSSS